MPEPGLGEHPTWTARRVRASWSSTLLAIGAVVVVVVVSDLFVAARQPLAWVAAAAATTLVLTPIVELLSRWVPRAVAIATTIVVSLVAVTTVGAGLFIEIRDQLGVLREELPVAAEEIEEEGGGGAVAQLELKDLVQDLVDETAERISPQPTIEDATGTAPAFFVSGVLVIFFLVWGGRMLEGLQRQIGDPERRRLLTDVARTAAHRTQRYVLGAVGLAATVASFGGLLAWWVGLPTPLVLGVVLGAASIVPYIGVLFGGMPLLLLSAASEPPGTTLALVLVVVALQAAVTVATRKGIEPRSLRVGPAVIVVTALVGSDLYGTGGALVAVLGGILVTAAVEAWGELEASEIFEASRDAAPS